MSSPERLSVSAAFFVTKPSQAKPEAANRTDLYGSAQLDQNFLFSFLGL